MENASNDDGVIRCTSEDLVNQGQLEQVWSSPIGGMPSTPLLIHEQTGYLVSRPRYQYNSFYIFSTPMSEVQLIAFNVLDGEIKWRFPKETVYSLDEVHAAGEYVALTRRVKADDAKNILILSMDDGALYKEYPIDSLEMTISPHHLFLRDMTRATYIYEIESGEEVASFLEATYGMQFVNYSGRIYSVIKNDLQVLDAQTLDQKLTGTLTLDGNDIGDVILFAVDRYGLLATYKENRLVLFSIAEPQVSVIWSTSYDGELRDLWPPVSSVNLLFIASEKWENSPGELLEIDINNGALVNRVSIPGVYPVSPPVVFNEKVYVLFSDNTLRSFTIPDLEPVVELHFTGELPPRKYLNTQIYPRLAVSNNLLIVAFPCDTLFAYHLKQP